VTVDARERRLAENEIIFREVNEKIEEAASGQGTDSHLFEFLCECSNVDCNLRFPLTLTAYEMARESAGQFLVAPGHELPEIEDVVFRMSHYQVVRKRGEAARLAEEHDPRS
jgi:hypothetical protein